MSLTPKSTQFSEKYKTRSSYNTIFREEEIEFDEKESFFNLKTSPGGKLIGDFIDGSGITSSSIRDYEGWIGQIFNLVDNTTPIPFNKGTFVKFQQTSHIQPSITLDYGKERPILPINTRNQQITYQFDLVTKLVEVTEEGEIVSTITEDKDKNKITTLNEKSTNIMKIPIMLYSRYCNLYTKTQDEKEMLGEHKGGPGGYFIINGREILLALIEQVRYDIFISYAKKDMDFCRMTCDSVQGTKRVEVFIMNKEKILRMDVPYLKINKEKQSLVLFDVYKFLDFERFHDIKAIEYEILRFIDVEFHDKARAIIEDSKLRHVKSDSDPEKYMDDIIKHLSIIKDDIIVEIKIKELTAKSEAYKKDLIKSKASLEEIIDHQVRFMIELAIKGLTKQQKLLMLGFLKGSIKFKKYFILKKESGNKYKSKVPKIFTIKEATKIYKEEMLANIFPQIPLKELDSKIFMLSLLSSMLIKIKLGIKKYDDRDHWKTKKIKTPGEIMFRTFSTMFSLSLRKMVDKIKTDMRKFRHLDFSNYNLEPIKNTFAKCFTNNKWNIYNSSNKNNIYSQELKRKSVMDTITHLTMITNTSGDKSKNTDSKMINLSSIMFICGAHTPEGKKCGDTKHFAQTARFTAKKKNDDLYSFAIFGILSFKGIKEEIDPDIYDVELYYNGKIMGKASKKIIKEQLKEGKKNGILPKSLKVKYTTDGDIEQMNVIISSDVSLYDSLKLVSDVQTEHMNTPLLHNSRPMGWVSALHAKDILKNMKRKDIIPEDSSITYNKKDNILYVYTDYGRFVRPVLVFNKNTGNLVIEEKKLRMESDFSVLRKEGAVEYIDSSEQDIAMIAKSMKDVKLRRIEKESLKQQIAKLSSLDLENTDHFMLEIDEIRTYIDEKKKNKIVKKFNKEKKNNIRNTNEKILNNKLSIRNLKRNILKEEFTLSNQINEQEEDILFNNILKGAKKLTNNILKKLDEQELSEAYELGKKLQKSLKKFSEVTALQNMEELYIYLFKTSIGSDSLREDVDKLDKIIYKLSIIGSIDNLEEIATEKLEIYLDGIEEKYNEKVNFIKILKKKIKRIDSDDFTKLVSLRQFKGKLMNAEREKNELFGIYNSLSENNINFSDKVRDMIENYSKKFVIKIKELKIKLRKSILDVQELERTRKHYSNKTYRVTPLGENSNVTKKLFELQNMLHKLNKKTKYEYMELDPNAMLGLAASHNVFPGHNMAPRLIYQTGHASQAIGIVHSRQDARFDTWKTLISPEASILRTEFDARLGQIENPAGTTLQVAFVNYAGWDVEDGIIMKKSTVERGAFHNYYRIIHKDTKENKSSGGTSITEHFGEPPLETRKRKPQYVYDNIDPETGLVRRKYADGKTREIKIDSDMFTVKIFTNDVFLKKGDCVIAKYKEIKKNGVSTFEDVSTYIKSNKGGVVEKTYASEINRKVKLRQYRIPIVGDKFSNRHAQKGVISIIMNDEDMPFVENTGMIPDIIVNNLGIPSRMTVGEILEIFLGKAAGIRMSRVNGTGFRNYDKEEVKDILRGAGYTDNGREIMRNGMTGERIDAEIFVGPLYVTALSHQAIDKMYARGLGAVEKDFQPNKGKEMRGGLKTSENARSAMAAHGAIGVFKDRMATGSDAVNLPFCDCGMIMEDIKGTPKCPWCKGGGNFVGFVAMPFVFKMFQSINIALGTKVGVKIAKDERYIKMMRRAGAKK